MPPLPRAILEEIGERGVRRLLRLHYRNLEASPLREMFPEDMEASADRSADFFIQLLGGPPHYVTRHGPPRMRARHLPFRIDEAARVEWLRCFREALDALPFPEAHREAFEVFLDRFSAWMVNTRAGAR